MSSEAGAPGYVDVTVLGQSTCGAVPWRIGGRLHVTVIVKASFAFAPGAVMTILPPDDLVREEVHFRNNPTQSVRLTGELWPYLPGADVLLTGHACAPEGTRVSALTARLSLYRDQTLLEKTIHVYAERKGADPVPFDRMPLVYERAFGGLGSDENPFGTGLDGRGKSPNLVDPTDPKKAACFAPISRTWPLRRRMLDKTAQAALKQPIAELSPTVDWTFFHAAPLDQRTAYLQGTEWVVLDGMHPSLARVQSRLPGAQAVAKIYGLGGPGSVHPLALVADTLRIDADELRCSVVWRGNFPVPSEDVLSAIRVAAGVEMPGQPLEWPALSAQPVSSSLHAPPPKPPPSRPSQPGLQAPPSERPGSAKIHPSPASASSPYEGTVTFDLQDEPVAAQVQARVALPFGHGQASGQPTPPSSRAPVVPANPVIREAGYDGSRLPISPAPAGSSKWEVTVATDEQEPPRAAKPLPFVAGPAVLPPKAPVPAPRPRPAVDPAERFANTMTVDDVMPAVAKAVLPFAGRTPAPVPIVSRPVAPIAPAIPAPPVAPEIPKPKQKAGRVALGIRLVHEGPLAFDVIPWGLSPSRDAITVIAKATCDLVSGGPATLRREAEPPVGEIRSETGAVIHPSDRVPFKTRADVLVVGHACAPGGSAETMEVALRFGAGAIDRRIRVSGDRRWEKALASFKPSAPAPFTRIPLVYERAFGGPRFGPNPSGVGHFDPMKRAPGPLPNLEDPEACLRSPKQTVSPACFAPIPQSFRDRWQSLGRKHQGWCSLAEQLDWTRFQAAPRAQQLPFLRGDEAFELAGMDAQTPVIKGSLPGLRTRCFAAFDPEARRFEEIPLGLDTVVIDADAKKVNLVWRGAVPVLDERRPAIEALYLLTEETAGEGISLAAARAKLLRD